VVTDADGPLRTLDQSNANGRFPVKIQAAPNECREHGNLETKSGSRGRDDMNFGWDPHVRTDQLCVTRLGYISLKFRERLFR